MLLQFIMLTISFTVALLLASGLTMLIVLNKKVIKAYMKWVNKMVEEITEEVLGAEDH